MTKTGTTDYELWAAIAEPSRRLLLDVLLASGESTPSSLAQVLPYSRQAVTKHLAVLEKNGLVESKRVGREVHYTVQAGRLNEATGAMTRVAAQWDKRLQDIKAIAEAAHQKADPKS